MTHVIDWTIPTSSLSASHVDFPVYGDLADFLAIQEFADEVRPDGGDIRIKNQAGSIEYAREVVSCATDYIDTTTADQATLDSAINLQAGDIIDVFYSGHVANQHNTWKFFFDWVGSGTRAFICINRTGIWGQYEFSSNMAVTVNGQSATSNGTTALATDGVVHLQCTMTGAGVMAELCDNLWEQRVHLIRITRASTVIHEWDARGQTGLTFVDSVGGNNGTLTDVGTQWASAGTGELHTKVDVSILSNTVLRVEVDGSSAEPASDSTYGSEAVWSGYIGSYHFQDDLSDSAGNLDAFSSSSAFEDAFSPLSGRMLGTGNALTGPTPVTDLYLSHGDDATLSAWINVPTTNVASSSLTALTGRSLSGGDNHINYNGDAYISFGDDQRQNHGAIITGNDSTLQHIVLVRDSAAGTRAVYVNGSLADTATGLGSSAYADRLNGDETNVNRVASWRLSIGKHSTDWISDEYDNRSAPSSFYTLAAVGGGSSVTPNDASQGQSIDQPTLTQEHVLTPDGVSHTHTLAQPTLSQGSALSPGAIAMAQILDQPSLTQAHIVAPNNLVQSVGLDVVTLTQAGALNADGLSQSQTLAIPGLTQQHVLTVQDVAQSQGIETSTLDVMGQLAVQSVAQAVGLDPANLTQYHVLAVQDLSQQQAIDAALFGGLIIGELQGEIVIYAAMGGTVHVIPALTGTIH